MIRKKHSNKGDENGSKTSYGGYLVKCTCPIYYKVLDWKYY